MNRNGQFMPRDGPGTHRDRAKESLESLTIDAEDRLQYVSQLVDVKHTGVSAINQALEANDGTCLAFACRRSGAALVFVCPLFADYEDTPS
ncbi:hypothetical protein [Paraburkholderia sediminicola]|uniref:hypothetical protein n=1 Tax=Paraburkholderia sediminicola TaxID=458836 RepID=UPI0038BA864B